MVSKLQPTGASLRPPDTHPCFSCFSVITICRDGTARSDPRWASDLDGQVLVVDPEGGYWVRFIVTRVPASPEKPHGIDYSLTLHGPDGERLVGFDNAHPVARQKRGEPQDHRHRVRTVRAYAYRDAATLLADFWAAVDAVLRERGVIL